MSKSDGLCIECKLPALPGCHSDAGRREFAISGLCEICFDAAFEDDDDGELGEFTPEAMKTLETLLKHATVEELTELQYAEIGDGPWKLYLFGQNGYHSGGQWFRRGPMKFPDEEITFECARKECQKSIAAGLEVRVCDGGDNLVFHSEHGVVLHGEDFWKVPA